jgi:polyisoprenoid-binding protein YceI
LASPVPGLARAGAGMGVAVPGQVHGLARALGLGLLLGAFAPAATAAPQRYALDPDRSWVQFEVLHFGTSTIRGRIGPIRGEVSLDPAAGRGEVGLRIATASVDTGLRVFDARLRADDLLDTAGWPEAFFVARQFRFDGERVAEVRGEFTLRGVSRPLSLVAVRYGCREQRSAEGAPQQVCGGDFEGELLRSEFGASFGLPLVGDRVRLKVQVEGLRR